MPPMRPWRAIESTGGLKGRWPLGDSVPVQVFRRREHDPADCARADGRQRRVWQIADFRCNRPYISAGNLSENDKAYIFLMDYPGRCRIKIWGRARVVDDPELIASLADPDYRARLDQAIVFEVAAWDVNCPQHITPRYTEADLEDIVASLKRRIAELEAQVVRDG